VLLQDSEDVLVLRRGKSCNAGAARTCSGYRKIVAFTRSDCFSSSPASFTIMTLLFFPTADCQHHFLNRRVCRRVRPFITSGTPNSLSDT